MSTKSKLRFPYWRGVLVVATWIVWPPAFFVAEFLVRLSVSTSRGCSIEGCNVTLSVLDLLAVLPPLIGTILWWRWRRRRHHTLRDASPS